LLVFGKSINPTAMTVALTAANATAADAVAAGFLMEANVSTRNLSIT